MRFVPFALSPKWQVVAYRLAARFLFSTGANVLSLIAFWFAAVLLVEKKLTSSISWLDC